MRTPAERDFRLWHEIRRTVGSHFQNRRSGYPKGSSWTPEKLIWATLEHCGGLSRPLLKELESTNEGQNTYAPPTSFGIMLSTLNDAPETTREKFILCKTRQVDGACKNLLRCKSVRENLLA